MLQVNSVYFVISEILKKCILMVSFISSMHKIVLNKYRNKIWITYYIKFEHNILSKSSTNDKSI